MLRECSKRRICMVKCTMAKQGKYFISPTNEDPFDDRQGKSDFTRANFYQEQQVILVNFKNEKMASQNGIRLENAVILSDDGCQGDVYENYEGCPSKFLMMCLNTIQNDLQHDEATVNERDTPFFALPWGFEFWKCYSNGKNIVDRTQARSSFEQIAWIASTASDTITRREEQGFSISTPFLLYLVPSQQEAVKVRQVCRPLKACGIHTISLHPGASIDHQIHGMRKCEPEFLISTPERLTELISLNAIDLSGVSLLVIDGPVYEGGSVDAIKTIRNFIPSSSQTLILGGCFELVSAL